MENVFFFFIVNQTHEFRGFARMRAPAKRNEKEIRWKLPDKMKAEGRSFGEVIKVTLLIIINHYDSFSHITHFFLFSLNRSGHI